MSYVGLGQVGETPFSRIRKALYEPRSLPPMQIQPEREPPPPPPPSSTNGAGTANGAPSPSPSPQPMPMPVTRNGPTAVNGNGEVVAAGFEVDPRLALVALGALLFFFAR